MSIDAIHRRLQSVAQSVRRTLLLGVSDTQPTQSAALHAFLRAMPGTYVQAEGKWHYAANLGLHDEPLLSNIFRKEVFAASKQMMNHAHLPWFAAAAKASQTRRATCFEALALVIVEIWERSLQDSLITSIAYRQTDSGQYFVRVGSGLGTYSTFNVGSVFSSSTSVLIVLAKTASSNYTTVVNLKNDTYPTSYVYPLHTRDCLTFTSALAPLTKELSQIRFWSLVEDPMEEGEWTHYIDEGIVLVRYNELICLSNKVAEVTRSLPLTFGAMASKRAPQDVILLFEAAERLQAYGECVEMFTSRILAQSSQKQLGFFLNQYAPAKKAVQKELLETTKVAF